MVLFVFDCAGSWLLLRLFSSCSEWSTLVAMSRLLLLQSMSSRHMGFGSLRAPGLQRAGLMVVVPGLRDLPGSWIDPVSPALAGGFFTSLPPGTPLAFHVLSLDQNFTRIPDLLNVNLLFNRIPLMSHMHIKARDALLQ